MKMRMFWFIILMMIHAFIAKFAIGIVVFVLGIPVRRFVNSRNISMNIISTLWLGLISVTAFSLWSAHCASLARLYGLRNLWLYGIIGFFFVLAISLSAIRDGASGNPNHQGIKMPLLELICWLIIPIIAYLLFICKPHMIVSMLGWVPFFQYIVK